MILLGILQNGQKILPLVELLKELTNLIIEQIMTIEQYYLKDIEHIFMI